MGFLGSASRYPDVDESAGSEAALKAGIERELKLEAEDGVDLDRLGGDPLDSHVFSSVYHDTDDFRLLRAGLTLRRRMENGASTWQLKIPHDGARLELEDAGGPGFVPSSLAAVLRGVARERELEPVATLRTHRRGRRVDGVDVTVDDVEVMDGQAATQRFTEIEAELVDGPVKALDRVGRTLRKLGARKGDARPKLLRVVRPRERAVAGAGDTTLEYVQRMLSAQYDELLRNDPIVRVCDDADAVHDMRVAVRRLRSVLRTAEPMLDERWVESLRDELDWLGERLGSVRDLDVLLLHLGRELEDMGAAHPGRAHRLLRPLEAERRDERARLLECLDEGRYRRVLDAVEAAAQAPPTHRSDLGVEELAAKEFRRLRKRSRDVASQSDAALHKTRIRAKRVRYAAELAEESRGKRTTELIAAAKELQDVLGDHQDAVVALGRLHDLARVADNDGAVLAGRLIERQELRKRRARHELPKAWRRLLRRGRRAWRRV
jgi:CHAD domain-containing protein